MTINLIGKIVKHNKYGEGIIVRQNQVKDGFTIYIYFENGNKEEIAFQFPQSFIGDKVWLTTEEKELLLYINHSIIINKENNKDNIVFDGSTIIEVNNSNSWIEETKDGVVLRRFNDLNAKKVLIPSNINVLSRHCFIRVKNLEDVVLMEGVKSIGEGAFEGLKKLKRIVLSKTLQKIGANAFFDCTALKSISIPIACTKIERRAFGCNYRLKEINCFHKKQPHGWHNEWNVNSKSKTMVCWGMKVIRSGQPIDSPLTTLDEGEVELTCNKENILYIYKGNIRCYKNHHHIISATAIISNCNNSPRR